jgi:hypothetical protein
LLAIPLESSKDAASNKSNKPIEISYASLTGLETFAFVMPLDNPSHALNNSKQVAPTSGMNGVTAVNCLIEVFSSSSLIFVNNNNLFYFMLV